MRLLSGAALLLLVNACSNLGTDSSGATALEILLPAFAAVEPGDTLILRARALDAKGDSIAATIIWTTPDTNLVALDTASGRVTAKVTSGIANVQARTGGLATSLFPLSLRPPSDTLAVVPPDTFRVTTGTTQSAALVAQVLTLAPPGGVAGTQILYSITSPTFADPATRTVEFPGGTLVLVAPTGADGGPTSPVLVQRVLGQTSPDSAVVSVQAFRPSGEPVPGSGQTLVVRFDP